MSDKIARYYSFCLTDAQAGRAAITKSAWTRLPYRRLSHTAFDGDRVERTQQSAQQDGLASLSRDDIEAWCDPGHDWVPLVWHPFLFERTSAVRHGIQTYQWAPDFLAPLSILLYAHRTGRLMVVGRPRFSRECLEPAAQGSLILGSVLEADQFYDANPFDDCLPPIHPEADELDSNHTGHPDQEVSLSEAFDYAQRLFDAVCQADPEQPIPGVRFTRRSYGVVLPARQGIGAIESLLRTYDAIETLQPKLPCFEGLVEPMLAPQKVEPEPIAKRLKPMVRWGTLAPTRELSEDQVQAIGAALMLARGDRLAIHGPPGTGKTAMLTELVASEVVLSVLQGRPAPKIVIASTNNQALRNALDAFRLQQRSHHPLSHEEALLTRRWIDDWPTLGFYNASRAAEADAKERGLMTLEDMERIERNADIQTLSMAFVQNTRAITRTGAIASIASATDALRAHLKAEAREQNWARSLPAQLRKAARDGNARQLLAAFKEHEKLWRRKGWLKSPAECAVWDKVRQGLERLVEAQKSVRQLKSKVVEISRRLNQAWSEDWVLKAVARMRAQKMLPNTVGRRLAKVQMPSDGDVPVYAELELRRVNNLLREAKAIARAQAEVLCSKTLADEWFKSNEAVLHAKARHRWFWLAIHVREGEWLNCMATTLRAGQKDGRTLEKVRAMLDRRYLLAPVMVSTLHRLPKILSFWDIQRQAEMPLFEQADLLIVDEAGQCAPDVAAASVSLTKCLVAVGDRAQLEPVWSLEQREDLGNRVAAELIEPANLDGLESERLSRSGGDTSSGSLLHLCQSSSRFTSSDREHVGVWLTKHRRCLPQIFEFCNQLAYQGRLESVREQDTSICPLPVVGYLDVPGNDQQFFGSRVNEFEAVLVARFVSKHKAVLQSAYDRPLGEIVAIVTPFRAQAEKIDGALRQMLGKHHGITVGTVHSLQGAERPVVLLSLTYTAIPCGRHYFWDHNTSMLNVAVSRAQDSIVVVGDLDTLNHSELPGRLLGKHLRTVGERLEWPEPPESGGALESWRSALQVAFGKDTQYKISTEDNVALLALGEPELGEVILVTSDLEREGLKKIGNAMIRAKRSGMSVTWLVNYEYLLEHPDSAVIFKAIETIRNNGVNVQYIGPTFGNVIVLPFADVALWAERSWMSAEPPVRIIAIENGARAMLARLRTLYDLQGRKAEKSERQVAETD
ncbi:superfamily I DNA/RNA helicase [Marinobacter lutaoensis]|uniref:Superfamily I DNA/RNA helicase n=1 Tax=Marinobacter lutaoensis TaxID=135739 RepID=A0A1V2DQI7_9GAMM|nr:superfamily I DNA/RNA helicase [Marinobacter lutaoensis]